MKLVGVEDEEVDGFQGCMICCEEEHRKEQNLTTVIVHHLMLHLGRIWQKKVFIILHDLLGWTTRLNHCDILSQCCGCWLLLYSLPGLVLSFSVVGFLTSCNDSPGSISEYSLVKAGATNAATVRIVQIKANQRPVCKGYSGFLLICHTLSPLLNRFSLQYCCRYYHDNFCEGLPLSFFIQILL